MTFHTVDVETSWLTDQHEAHIVLAQVKPPLPETMRAGASRPWVVQTVQRLLGPDEALTQIVTGQKPALLLLPELALGIDDWESIDALVRAWERPLILIAGYGFAKGQQIKAWLDRPTETTKRGAWKPDGGPADGRTYNGGWCWVHEGNSTSCTTFLKATAEQFAEIQVEGLDHCSSHLVIKLKDLLIFPTICSDLLSVHDGQRFIEQKIRAYLTEHDAMSRTVLIAGLLLQRTASDKWRNAVLDVARSISTTHVNVCLVNSSWDIFAHHENVDRWRAYSGVYVASGRKPFLEQFSAVRRFSTEQIDGVVLRSTSPFVAGGPMRWSFEGATGRHLWVVQKCYGLEDAGTLNDGPCTNRFQFELLRLLRRVSSSNDAPSDGTSTLAKEAYKAIHDQILPSPSEAPTICRKALFGDVDEAGAETLTPDTLSEYLLESASGLRVLGALKLKTPLDWQPQTSERGQLYSAEKSANVLVWHSPDSAIAMRQVFQRWRSLPSRPPLVAFRKATGPSYAPPPKISDRRRDVTEAPPPTDRSAAEPKPESQVIEADLDDIEHCFAENSPDNFATAVQTKLASAFAQLSVGE